MAGSDLRGRESEQTQDRNHRLSLKKNQNLISAQTSLLIRSESGSLAHTQGEMTTKRRESQEAGVTGAILEAAKHRGDAYNFVSYF